MLKPPCSRRLRLMSPTTLLLHTSCGPHTFPTLLSHLYSVTWHCGHAACRLPRPGRPFHETSAYPSAALHQSQIPHKGSHLQDALGPVVQLLGASPNLDDHRSWCLCGCVPRHHGGSNVLQLAVQVEAVRGKPVRGVSGDGGSRRAAAGVRGRLRVYRECRSHHGGSNALQLAAQVEAVRGEPVGGQADQGVGGLRARFGRFMVARQVAKHAWG